MLGARYAVAAAPAPAPSVDSPYIEVEKPAKKKLLRLTTGAVVRLRTLDARAAPFGVCDAFDAKSNSWEVRFFTGRDAAALDGLERAPQSPDGRLVGEARLVGPLNDAEAMHEATRARDWGAVRALIERRPPESHERTTGFTEEDFECPVCRDVLWKPVVKQCGHAACFMCTHRAMDQLAESACPLCRAPFHHLGAVCEPLHSFIVRTFPSGGSAVIEDEQFRCRTCGVDGAVFVGNCGHVVCEACRHNECACGARRVFTPRVPCALLELASNKARAPRRPRMMEAQAPERNDADDAPYVHFGVGCDGCGAFPIRGNAFRCLDCPDAVGFDLCGECRTSSPHVVGRFEQGHSPSHRVVEREQVRTWLHELQAANPQLGVHQVLDLARMQLQAAAPPPPDTSSDDESFSRSGPGDPPRTA